MGSVAMVRVGCEFDRFLYATVGDDGNGMPLTVLSALARMDVDPWEEAAKLMRLPQDSAIKELATSLGALNINFVVTLDLLHLAKSLVALLPRSIDCAQTVRAPEQAVPVPAQSSAVGLTLLYLSSYVIFILLSLWVTGNRQASVQARTAASSVATIDEPVKPGVRETAPGTRGPP